MANQFFGNIGDIWKHLPLAEILRIERPLRYWESHAGSAKYPLTASPGRDYGVHHFLECCSAETALRESTYNSVLGRIAVPGNLKEHPGSPLVAMLVLDEVSARYLFVDIDADSCESIREAGRELQIDDHRLVIAADDGMDVIGHAADQLAATDGPRTFVHLDPYEPLLKSANGVDCVELFVRLVMEGMQSMLWYGFDSHEHRNALVNSAHKAYRSRSPHDSAHIWCGEIVLAGFEDLPLDDVPGVLACGILCGNISERSEVACSKLGNVLVAIYRDAQLPNGRDGAIRFRSERIEL